MCKNSFVTKLQERKIKFHSLIPFNVKKRHSSFLWNAVQSAGRQQRTTACCVWLPWERMQVIDRLGRPRRGHFLTSARRKTDLNRLVILTIKLESLTIAQLNGSNFVAALWMGQELREWLVKTGAIYGQWPRQAGIDMRILCTSA